jgi:hypothetical protein
MATGGLPESIHPELLTKHGEGLSSRAIAAWLKDEKGIVVTHHTVARFLKATLAERGATTRKVVQEELSRSVISDVDVLSRRLGSMNALAARLAKHLRALDLNDETFDDRAKTLVAVTESVRKLAETKLHFAGADTTDGSKPLGDLLALAFGTRESAAGEVAE